MTVQYKSCARESTAVCNPTTACIIFLFCQSTFHSIRLMLFIVLYYYIIK